MGIRNLKKSNKVGTQKQLLGRKKQTRIEILRSLAENTGLLKVQIESVFSALSVL